MQSTRLNRTVALILLSGVGCTTHAMARPDEIVTKKTGEHRTRKVDGGRTDLTGSTGVLLAEAQVLALDTDSVGPFPYDGTFPQYTRVASDSGTKYTAEARAWINVTTDIGGWKWQSVPKGAQPKDGSYAIRKKNKSKAVETYFARAVVPDPGVLSGIAAGDLIEFAISADVGTTLEIGLMDEGEIASAQISSFDYTSLNGMGKLWSWAWSASSLEPGLSHFLFLSHPALGLDDAAIIADFESKISFDPLSNSFSLSDLWSVSVTVATLPGQVEYAFGGEDDIQIAGGAVPTPGALSLGIVSGLALARRRRGR